MIGWGCLSAVYLPSLPPSSRPYPAFFPTTTKPSSTTFAVSPPSLSATPTAHIPLFVPSRSRLNLLAHCSQQRLTNLASRLFRVIHPVHLKHFFPHKMSPVVLETPVINMHNAGLGSIPRLQQFPPAQPEQPSNSSSSETRQGGVLFIHVHSVSVSQFPLSQFRRIEWRLECPGSRSFTLYELWHYCHSSLEA